MKNVKLGRKVLNVIDEHPELLHMRTFATKTECGTVACLAGHAMLLSGYTVAWRGRTQFYRPDGELVLSEVSEAAALLVMGQAEARSCFFDSDGPERFRGLVEEAEGRPE